MAFIRAKNLKHRFWRRDEEGAVICSMVEESLNAVNMSAYRRHSPNKLSGGQKQRVAVTGVVAITDRKRRYPCDMQNLFVWYIRGVLCRSVF